MALGAYEKYNTEDLMIIPIGLNYTNSLEFRSELLVDTGDPILLKDYLGAYRENPRKAILQITREIQKQLKERVIHIDKDEDADWINMLLKINRNDQLVRFWPSNLTNENKLLREEVGIADKANSMSVEEKKQIAQNIGQYQQALKGHGLTDKGLSQHQTYKWSDLLFLVMTFPLFLPGFLTNYIPFYFGKKVADAKVKRPEFHLSIRLGVCLAVYTVQFLLLIIVTVAMAIYFANPYLAMLVLAVPFLGYFSVNYQDIYKRWRAVLKAHQIDRKELEQLKQKRKAILQQIKGEMLKVEV